MGISALSGCGSEDTGNFGSGTFDGTVDGHSVKIKDAIFTDVTLDLDGDEQPALLLITANRTGLCDAAEKGKRLKDVTSFVFSTYRFDEVSGALPLNSGVYEADGSATNSAVAFVTKRDSNCDLEIADEAGDAKAGTITLTSFSFQTNGRAKGSFDLTFGSGDTTSGTGSGTFDAVYCAALQDFDSFECE